jgi:hypothetical protein
MHPGVLAARNQVVAERIERAAVTLARRFELSMSKPVTGNNPQVMALKRLETVADLLEGLVASTKANPVKKDKVNA